MIWILVRRNSGLGIWQKSITARSRTAFLKNGSAVFGVIRRMVGRLLTGLNGWLSTKTVYEYTVTRIKQICEVYAIDRCNLSKDHKADWILQNCFDGWKTESTTKIVSDEPTAERLKKFLLKKKGAKTAKKQE